MKTSTTSILTTAATALFLASAQADNVYIVGAQASRTTINPAINAIPGITLKATSGATTNASDVNNALFNLWQLGNGDYVAVNYNGGEAAVSTLLSTNSAFNQVPFLATNQTGANIATNAISDLHQPQIAVANTGRISRFTGTTVNQLVGGVLIPQNYGNPADDSTIDVSTYGFAADQSFTNTGVTSITAAQARVLFASGHVPLSYLSGKTNDAASTVWLIGRNIDAGARVVVYNETGAGALANTLNNKAFSYVTNAGVKTISSLGLTPPTVVNGIPQAPGNDGEAQGSTLIKNIYPVVPGGALNVVTTTITYATNTVTNTTYTTNYPTNTVVTTNVTTAYQPRQTNVPNVSTNYTYVTNSVWTNSPVTNKVYVTYNNPWTNAAKTLGNDVVKYKYAAKAGKFFEATLVTPQTSAVTNTGTVAKPKLVTNITTATFSVNEYYNDVLATNWVQVPSVTTNVTVVTNGFTSQTVYVQVGITNLATNYVVSDTPVITSSTREVLVPVATGTNTSTNAWTNSGPNYLLTYDSLANIVNSKNTNGNGQLPILLSYNGVGANGAVATTNNPSIAAITSQVANGSYTLWNYDHLFLNATGVANSSATLIRDSLKTYLSTSVSFPNLKLGDLNVNSAGDGATPFPKGL